MLPLIAGQQEYGLPAGTIRVFRLYVDGVALTPVPYTDIADGDSASYYQNDSNQVGFVVTPQTDGTAWIYYAISPLPLGLDDTPLIPPETFYLLRHYAAWRIIMVQGGAQRISEAERQHRLFTDGIKKLRREMTPQGEAAAQQFRWRGKMPSDQEFAVPLGAQGLNFRDQPSIVGFGGFIDALNWRLDEDGAPTKRLGYDTYRDPGGATVQLPAIPLELTPYAPFGGTNSIIAACADGKSYTSPGDGTWTQIASGMSGSATPDYAMLNDILYWTNGIDQVQSWNGTALTAIAAAPKGTVCAVWRNRLWIAGVAGFAHRVYWSTIGDPPAGRP